MYESKLIIIMKLLLGTAGRNESTKCFFCGGDFTFQEGDHICSIRFEDRNLEKQFGQHVCSSCAGLDDENLQDRFEKRVSEYRSRAEALRKDAQELEEKASELEEIGINEVERIWHHSAME